MVRDDDLLFVTRTLENGLALLRAGRPLEALRLYREVLARIPDQPEALCYGGAAAAQIGDAAQGLELLQAAVLRRPDDVDTRTNLGNVLAAAGRIGEAEVQYRKAVALRPDSADGHYNLGVALETQGRRSEAIVAYDACLDIAAGYLPARFNRANLLKSLGRLDEAIGDYRTVVAAAPGNTDALSNLGSALQELGRLDAAEKIYRQVLETAPDHVEARYNLATVLQECDETAAAATVYAEVLDRAPGHVGAQVNLGYALQQQGRLADAAAAFRRAIATAPDFAGAYVNLADLYLREGAPRKALAVCDDFLKRHPGAPAVLAIKGVVLDASGEAAARAWLVDFDRFLRLLRIAPPRGFADLAAFNAALVRHILAHPSLVEAPLSHATRRGRHSGELLAEPQGPFAAFSGVVREAVAAYREVLAAEDDHPFVASAPDDTGLSVWGVVMPGGGHQVPHIHPAAWLSGVYYPQLPDAVGAAGEAGWIEFGRPPAHLHAGGEPEVRTVRPEAGLMLLFPSYFHHRTIPFEGPGTRVSIAFDVLPKG